MRLAEMHGSRHFGQCPSYDSFSPELAIPRNPRNVASERCPILRRERQKTRALKSIEEEVADVSVLHDVAFAFDS